ncbi:MAG: hypothetical protein ACP5E4_02740 [Candidatus Aenigmatarchaeota archaeon]
MPSKDCLFGKLLRLAAVLIMVFPLVFLGVGLWFGLIHGPGGFIAAFAAFFVLLILCSALGGKVYQIGLEIELHSKGVEYPAELRKKLEPLLGDRPESFRAVEVPESLAGVDMPVKSVSPKKKR